MYYNLRKDKILYSYECECGGRYSKANKSKHLKTKKHLNFEESNKQKDPKINQAIIICEKDTEITIKFNDELMDNIKNQSLDTKSIFA